jgi:hypothetical protein
VINFLLERTLFEQFILVVVVFGGGSVLGLYLVRHYVPVARLRENHEIAGITFGVVGAFYGLFLAFVIVAAWERFDLANAKAHEEATALESLYKLGAPFPQPARGLIDNAVRDYTLRVIDEEWPEMIAHRYRQESEGAHKLWQVVLSTKPADDKQQLLLESSIEQLNAISDARSMRLLYYSDNLPPVVWVVISLGCVITIGFSYFFGSNRFRPQIVMCGTFSILLGMTILAILDLAHPYQGVMSISSQPFHYALGRMQELAQYHIAGR